LLLLEKKEKARKNHEKPTSTVVSRSLQQNTDSSEHNCGTYIEKTTIHTKRQFLPIVSWTKSHLLFKCSPKRRVVLCTRVFWSTILNA